MSLKESMQVSMVMATLRAVTTRHRHTDRISGDTYHHIYLPLPVKGRGVREHKSTQKARMVLEGKLQVLIQLASEKHKPCKTTYKTPWRMIALRDFWPA